MADNKDIKLSETDLFSRISGLIEDSRRRVATAINTAMVYTYYGVGQYIVEFEQNGNQRAQYGKQVLINLSEKLTNKFGKGWSVETLDKCRKLFKIYSDFPFRSILQINPDKNVANSSKLKNYNFVCNADEIRNNQNNNDIDNKNQDFVCTADEIRTNPNSNIDGNENQDLTYSVEPIRTNQNSITNKIANASKSVDSNFIRDIEKVHRFTLSWNHYQILMRVDNDLARSFYEVEATLEQWSYRQLQRQVASSLFERLALSREKDEVMRLANEGQTIEKPSDIIKDPLVLEFIGLKPEASYSESDLEGAIISKLQDFLLELGKGFLFEARQKRFTFDEDNFYVDLVFYNRLLQCYVLIDIKTDKLTHQDLGQMQMYVNYFDRYVKQDFEKPSIGILLCETKNDTLVELTLPKDANIYAQQYAVCLPDKQLLQRKVNEWVAEYNLQKQLI